MERIIYKAVQSDWKPYFIILGTDAAFSRVLVSACDILKLQKFRHFPLIFLKFLWVWSIHTPILGWIGALLRFSVSESSVISVKTHFQQQVLKNFSFGITSIFFPLVPLSDNYYFWSVFNEIVWFSRKSRVTELAYLF